MFLKILLWSGVIAFLMLLQVQYVLLRGIFFPLKELEATPADFDLDFQDVEIKTANNKSIHGWFMPFNDALYTMLFLHGNAGNISHRIDKLLVLRRSKISIFIIDYQGFGKSSGKPSEKAVYIDAKAAYDYLRKERGLDKNKIILYGESLGGAAAIDLAIDNEVGGLIVEGTLSSAKDIGKYLYPFIPSFFVPNIFDSNSKIKSVTIPKLFIHSQNDEIVPFKLAQKLFSNAPEPKKLIQTNGGHNTSFLDCQEEFFSGINDFIRGL